MVGYDFPDGFEAPEPVAEQKEEEVLPLELKESR